MELLGKLIRICRRHLLKDAEAARISGPREPYIPFLPMNGNPAGWNRVLVLGEAQNLSKTYAQYVRCLQESSARQRIRRLYWESQLHVGPWDDGTLKLAMCAAFNGEPEHFAVSNAVLWSQLTKQKTNQTPSTGLRARSAAVWREMLPIIDPAYVVTTGLVAGNLISAIKTELRASWVHVMLSSASNSYLAGKAARVNDEALLRRFPAVAAVLENHPEFVAKYRRNKLYFASTAVAEVEQLL